LNTDEEKDHNVIMVFYYGGLICCLYANKVVLYLNLRFQTPMKCSNRVGEVPEHGPELHVLLPWVAVTMHRVSWLPARIVCLEISITMFKVPLDVHIINITLDFLRESQKKKGDLEMETAGCSTSTAEDLVAKKRGVGELLSAY
jgi:hypothetical protein